MDVKIGRGSRRLSSKRSDGEGDFLGLLLFPLSCDRSVVSECAHGKLAHRQQGSQHGTTHPVEVESMPTFSVLFHADDVPRRARVSFDDGQDLAVTAVAVFHQLIVFGPVAHAQCHPVLVFALQA
jgi:hypothetical protein